MCTKTVAESLSGYSCLLYDSCVFVFGFFPLEVPKQGIVRFVIQILHLLLLRKEKLKRNKRPP